MLSIDVLRQPGHWASVLRWATIAGIELAVIGPFGSYKGNIFYRLCYWIALSWIAGLTLWPGIVTALSVGPPRGFPPMFSVTTTALIASIPLAGAAAMGCYLLWPVHASGIRIVEWYALTAVMLLPAAAALVWLELAKFPTMFALQAEVAIRPTARAIDPAGDEAKTSKAWPEHILASALCLQMEDHHIRVHTRGRSFLHYGVMRDVVEAMPPQRGLLVHRSWWVARDSVQSWYRDERSAVLVLSNDLQVPIARNRLATLRSEGWLASINEIRPIEAVRARSSR